MPFRRTSVPRMRGGADIELGTDGLGNVTHNALPTCQLTHLQNLANELHAPEIGDHTTVPFWIDTLCVPANLIHREYRKLAITKMAQIFGSASKVLVLDSDLLQISRDSPPLELYMRVKLSRWIGRLWTLQEGLMAKHTFFQFRDGAVRSNDIYDGLQMELCATGRNRYTKYEI